MLWQNNELKAILKQLIFLGYKFTQHRICLQWHNIEYTWQVWVGGFAADWWTIEIYTHAVLAVECCVNAALLTTRAASCSIRVLCDTNKKLRICAGLISNLCKIFACHARTNLSARERECGSSSPSLQMVVIKIDMRRYTGAIQRALMASASYKSSSQSALIQPAVCSCAPSFNSAAYSLSARVEILNCTHAGRQLFFPRQWSFSELHTAQCKSLERGKRKTLRTRI